MSLQFMQLHHWDDQKIQEMIDLKQKIQGDLPTYFPEDLKDYKKLLHPDSPFSADYQWVGFMVYQNGDLVAKAILSWRNKSKIGNLGFIDWIQDENVAILMIQKIETFAKSIGINQIKTPVDINFFVRYRIRSFSSGPAYFGEPIYPDYYHHLFLAAGFNIIGTWDTYIIKRFSSVLNFMTKRKKLKERKHSQDDAVTVRCINFSKWDEELKIVYDLFIKSFHQMTEFESITFEQFKLIYDDFRYVAHPLTSYIVELNGIPVGFSINYPDPLEKLASVKNKSLNKWQKILLLAKLRLNFKTLLMPYMGKISGPNGEEIKGVFIKVSKRLSLAVLCCQKALVCYQSPDSPSRRPLDPELITPYAQYVLYGKKLE